MKSSSGYIRLPEHAETNCSGHCSRRTGTRRARGSGDGIPSNRAVMVDARSEPEYEPRAHTTTRRSMVTLAARRFSEVRPCSYADARLETRHAQLVPDLPLRLCGAWLTRAPAEF